MTLRDRIGFDAGSTRVEDALDWAARHGFHHVDFNADTGANLHDGVRLARRQARRARLARRPLVSHPGLLPTPNHDKENDR
jgi:hypothetical protein